MPVIGKKEESEARIRELKWVLAQQFHSSRIIPTRQPSEKVKQSVRRDSQQQPIIARPCTCNLIPEPHLEIVDGHNRFYGIGFKGLIWVDVRYGLSDYEAFRLADTLHKREDRSTFENAEFYAKMVEIKQKESGGVRKLDVALDCQINPNLLPQYEKINRLYKVLKAKYPNSIKTFRSFGINRLYNLSKLLDYPQLLDITLPKALEKLKKNPRMTAKQIKQMVDRLVNPSRDEAGKDSKDEPIEPRSDILQIDVPSDLTKEIKNILFWIEDIAEAEAKESKTHWTKRRKILAKFYAKGLQTLDEIALGCLRMGVEDVKYGRKVYPLTLDFEVLHGVPIGFKGIIKERPKLQSRIERPPPPSILDFIPKEDIVSLNALRQVDKGEAPKIKLEVAGKEEKKSMKIELKEQKDKY